MAKNNIPAHTASYEHLFVPDHNSGDSFRLGLLAALMIHVVIFAITWPTFARTQDVRQTRVIACRLQPVKFVEPPPPEQRFTVPPRRVPIPDPDPQGPEPIIRSEPEAAPIDFPKEVLPFFPEAPPTEEESAIPGVFRAGIEVEPPRTLHRVEPLYTETARKIRFEGAVILSLLIDTKGRVADVTVLRGLPFGLTESAVAAASQWLFEPCTFNDKPVSVRMTLTVRFSIAS